MAKSLKRYLDIWLRRQDYIVKGETKARMIKWTLFSIPWIQLFYHRFNGPDWTADPHDHPSGFISIGLKGSYTESVYDAAGNKLYDREWKAPWLRSFPPTHIHRTSAVGPKGASTICITGKFKQNWGFFVDRKLVPWRDYMKVYRLSRMDVRSQALNAKDNKAREAQSGT